MTDFTSLHNQTDYSILDSLIAPKDLFLRAKELGQSAIAITDHGTLGAAWESLKASKDIGVKLIMGIEGYFADDATNIAGKLRHLVLLAKNAIGYRNILTLNKCGFDQGHFIGKRLYPIIDWKLLEQYHDGIICLTACGNGIINQLLMIKENDRAETTLLKLKELFQDNLGLEVQPNNMKRNANIYNEAIDQQFLNRKNIELGKKHQIRVVPACNAHYLKKEDSATHDVFLAIGSHQTVFSNFRLRYPVPEFYLKTGEEVKNFFARNYGDTLAEQLCANTIYFANQCEMPEWINPKFSNPSGKELAIFPVQDEPNYQDYCQWLTQQSDLIHKLEPDKAYLRYKCYIKFDQIKTSISSEKHQIYLDRINEELDTLEYQGFSSYMLIVGDIVNWCEHNHIPVGPGRGSCGGCFVAYLLGIHKADSIKYDLIFERFQNKQKTQYPDIDQDVSTYYREQVLSYLRHKYGNDNMCAISNYNTITPKVYMRDMARALEFNGSKEAAVQVGNDLAAFIGNDTAKLTDIHKIINKTPILGEYCKKYPDIAQHGQILGKARAHSQHAAGIVISQRSLVGLAPLKKDKDNTWTIEYDKDLTEENGFVKMDILGVSTLDIIENVIREIKKANKPFNNEHLDYDANDLATYELISRGETFGVFQLGTSAGTIDLCKRIKPRNIEDLAIITALARPASANIRNEFIATREGKTNIALLHPSLNNAFQKTYGFGLFDESILQLGRDVAGWNLNDADRIRKMIKDKGKNPDKDKKLRAEFIEGAIKNGISHILAPRIWDEEVGKFASYTFNKSHAIFYSMVSYQTAYLKAHFPIEFLLVNLMAEVKSNAPNAAGNIAQIKKELKAHKVKLLPPDFNTSQFTYAIQDNKLLTGLDALKFVGDEAIQEIIAKRPFKSFFDFMTRVSSKTVRANSIQALAASGALDAFKIPRKLIFLYCSDYRKKLQVWLKKHNPSAETFNYPWPNELEWRLSELYALEQFYLGEAFVCKTADAYGNFFKDPHKVIYEVKKAQDKTRISPIKGVVKDFFEFKVKKEGSKYYGQPMLKIVIEDKNGDQCGCTIFPDTWKKMQTRIQEINSKVKFDIGLGISFGGSVNYYEGNIGLIVNDLFDIAPIPAKPKDLKAQKINMREMKSSNQQEIKKVDDLFEHIEDTLYNEGLIDLNKENGLDLI